MSFREQTIIVCDGHCGTEVPVDREFPPADWVQVQKQNVTRAEHYCPDCWRTAILAILDRINHHHRTKG